MSLNSILDRDSVGGGQFEFRKSMALPKYSLRWLMLACLLVAMLVGALSVRISRSRSVREATRQIWMLGGETIGYLDDLPHPTKSEQFSLQFHFPRSVWHDIVGYDQPVQVLLNRNKKTQMDEKDFAQLESAIGGMPKLRHVLMYPPYLPDETIASLRRKYPQIRFDRYSGLVQ